MKTLLLLALVPMLCCAETALTAAEVAAIRTVDVGELSAKAVDGKIVKLRFGYRGEFMTKLGTEWRCQLYDARQHNAASAVVPEDGKPWVESAPFKMSRAPRTVFARIESDEQRMVKVHLLGTRLTGAKLSW